MPRPSSSSSFDEDIAERRVSDALATTLLLVSAVCLLGAIVIQVYECYLYRRVPGATALLSDASGRRGAAEIHADNLKADPVRTCTQIEAAYKRGAEEKPKKGHIEGTNFIADEPMDLSDEMKTAVEQLCAQYGYGYKIFAPVVNAREASAPSRAEDEEEPAEEEPAAEPAEDAPAEDEPAAEPAEDEPAEEDAGGAAEDISTEEEIE